jgi:REP element-mobilizing transposase RayT
MNRKPLLHKRYRWNIINHIRSKGEEREYHIDVVNGVEDHLHALVAYPATQNVSRIVNDIKGESSHWINVNNVLQLNFTFRWRESYAAFSVSPQGVKKVRKYILNQEKHHKDRNFKDELHALGNR